MDSEKLTKIGILDKYGYMDSDNDDSIGGVSQIESRMDQGRVYLLESNKVKFL